ncbi:FAD-dependent monooxygenase [Streptomyces sp. NPDC059837]|uniref:FAD-dependent monooxygenase n=1 Tax=Streptomyces sp. NPDC059837 TaxID=3346968 RepID=UPI0036674117
MVGAGPVGLLLAGTLAEVGRAVTMLKCRSDTEANTSRAWMVHARALEQLDIRQVAEHLRTTGGRLTSIELIPLEVTGHGAGMGWVWAARAGRWCDR